MTDKTTTGSDAVDLLPCPFCGSANISAGEVSTTDVAGETVVQSVCMDCGACGPGAALDEGEIDYGDVKSSAAWNRRALIAQARAAAPTNESERCPVCADGVLVPQISHYCTACGTAVASTAELKANREARAAAPAATAQAAGDELHTLRRLIECAEALDMRKLFAEAKALHNKLAAPVIAAPTATSEPVATIDTLEFRALLGAYTEAMRHASLMMPGTVNAAAAKRSALIAHINAKLIAPAPQQAAPLTDLIVAYGAACTAMNEDARRDLMAEIKQALSAGSAASAGDARDAQQWRGLLECVMAEIPNRFSREDGNAPGHGHSIPGIWDSDNGPKAGKECAWCNVWNAARKALDIDRAAMAATKEEKQ